MKKWQKWKWYEICIVVEVWAFTYVSKRTIKNLSQTLKNEESQVAHDLLSIV